MVQAYGSFVGATTGYEYDEDGNVTLQSNPNGTSIASSYDDQGNLTSQTWYAAGGAVANSLAYTYDEDGNILTASNDAGSYSFAYNADGEQTLAVTPSGVTLNYEYDSEGNTTQVTDSLGDTITSQYDADDNLTSRGYSGPNSAQLLLTFEYDGDGNLMSVNRYSDLAGTQLVGASIYAYNPQGLVSSIQHSAGGTMLATFAYNYDAAGELTSGVDNGTTTAYAYDAAGQLTSAGPTNYAYDANGNPNQSSDTIGPNNELLSDGTWNYSYDLDGNMTGKTGVSGGPDAGLTWSYTYDASNELTGATETNAQSQTLVQANYTYDVFGNRIQSSVSLNGGAAVVTNFVYNGSTLWAQLNGSGSLQDLYVSGDQPDQWLARVDGSGTVGYYLTDHLGSVRDVMNTSSQIIAAADYDAFGNAINVSNPTQLGLLMYAGYYWNPEIGAYTDGSRIYGPDIARYWTQDPTGLTPDSNNYRYTHNGPTNAIDPTGLEEMPASRYAAKPDSKRKSLTSGVIITVKGERVIVFPNQSIDELFLNTFDDKIVLKGKDRPDFMRVSDPREALSLNWLLVPDLMDRPIQGDSLRRLLGRPMRGDSSRGPSDLRDLIDRINRLNGEGGQLPRPSEEKEDNGGLGSRLRTVPPIDLKSLLNPGGMPRPANRLLSPEEAKIILENVSKGKPAFEGCGLKSSTSWFVLEGDPYTGVEMEGNLSVNVEARNLSNALRFTTEELDKLYKEIYDANAKNFIDQQVRDFRERNKGLDPAQGRMKQIEWQAKAYSQRLMWEAIAQRVAQSKEGVAQVILKSSQFSRQGDGTFVVVAEGAKGTISLKGGAEPLLKMLKETPGIAVEPEVVASLEAAVKTKKAAARVRGAFRIGGKVFLVIGLARDGYEIWTAENKAKTITTKAGGWTGAFAASGAFSLWYLPADTAGPWAWAVHGVGSFGAGAIGYWAGSEITEIFYEWAVESP
jgi:RHS repeat-associated protein